VNQDTLGFYLPSRVLFTSVNVAIILPFTADILQFGSGAVSLRIAAEYRDSSSSTAFLSSHRANCHRDTAGVDNLKYLSA